MASPTKPWPKEATSEKGEAIEAASAILKNANILNEIALQTYTPQMVKFLAAKFLNCGRAGQLCLEKDWRKVGIKRWPHNANHARLIALKLFDTTVKYAGRLRKMAESGDVEYVRSILQQMSFSLIDLSYDALELLKNC